MIVALLVAAAALPATSRAQAESTVATGAPPAAHQVQAAGSTPRSYACAPVVAIACGVVGGAVDVVGDVAGGIVGTVGDGVLDGVSKWVGQGAAWIIGRIAGLVERSTRPELGATWFTDQYGRMLSLGLLLALAFLLAALVQAALRQDVTIALRAALISLPLAICACFAAVTLVELALAATDDATRVVTSGTGGDSRRFFEALARIVSPSPEHPTVMPGFLALLGGLLTALLCIVVWIELILREAAVYLAVGFLPLSLAAMVWQRTAHLVRRLVEGLAAIILSKLTIAAAVAFAASALTHGGSGKGGITVMLAGCAVLFLAALSPWALLRLMPLAGDEIGLHRGAVRQAVGSAPGARTASSVVRAGMYASFAPAAVPAAATAAGAGAGAGAAKGWRPPPPPSSLPMRQGPPLGRTTGQTEKSGDRRGA